MFDNFAFWITAITIFLWDKKYWILAAIIVGIAVWKLFL